MPTEQYHEPPEELSQKTRTLARMLTSLIEEAEAIDWYEQRLALEKDPEARAIMENAQQEEFKHFAMNLEFLSRRNEKWRTVLQDVLFKEGDIVEHSGSNSSGFRSFGQFNPAKGSGLVIFMNGDGGYRLRTAVIERIGDL